MTEVDFIKHYVANASQIMWFLGAGTSRTAGLPTATDIIWDLKLKHYCREENQDIKIHDITNENIKRRIQGFMDSKGFPKAWSPEEYSFYFELTFGNDYGSQQKYLADQLNPEKISLSIGHRALAGLVSLSKARIIYTTNFDDVIEAACAKVAGMTIPTYHLEGSYAALDSLNSERFPIYAKIHGDFKYRSIKNLSADLIANDQEIQKCFVASSGRYGLIVSGYSGRDTNVMSMFDKAIEQPNAFPKGLFWTVTSLKNVPKVVQQLIKKAQEKGINAQIVETGTFDSMLSKIWRQIPDRNNEIDQKVRTALVAKVNIPLGQNGKSYPILRTNALPITALPERCAIVSTQKSLTNSEVKELVLQNRPNAIICRAEQILGWGAEEEIIKALGKDNIKSISEYKLETPVDLVTNITGYHAFFERALAISLCHDKPLCLRNDKGFTLSVDPQKSNDPLLKPLRDALADRNGNEGKISGVIPKAKNITWSEAISIKLEDQNGKLWLMLKPTLWIDPPDEKRNQFEFIRSKKRFRYNKISNSILDAWIKILFGSTGKAESVEISCFRETKYPAIFKVNTRTAYTRK